MDFRPLTWSKREREVLEHLARGQTVEEIARDLFISPKTVMNHCTHIREKKGLANMHQLIVYAVRYVYALEPFQALLRRINALDKAAMARRIN